MATIEAVERNLISGWDELVAGIRDSDADRIWEARSDLASTMGYLTNFFEEYDSRWNGFGADDLLDAEYEFPTPSQMKAVGLMCWGGDDGNLLSPFVGEFERDGKTNKIKNYTLYFSVSSPDDTSWTIPYTSDADVRRQLLERRPKLSKDWPQIHRRADLFSANQ